jgi:glycosyltransferase involved in cell wall biosynthesis
MSEFLFIASDYKPKPGGIAAYIDSLARGLRSLGDNVRVLAIVPEGEKERLRFLEDYEEWVDPFPVVHDERPSNWLGNKCLSVLEIVRCMSPRARHMLERTKFFRSSFRSVSKFEDILHRDNPGVIVFGHLDRKLYPFALTLLEWQIPYGIVAHDAEIYRYPFRVNDLITRGAMLNGARWIAANSRHTKGLLEMWKMAEDKIMIVHPPVSEQVINESGNSDRGVKDSVYTLVTVCRLVRSKGIDIVLHALKIMEGKGIPFRYVIVGDGEERSHLEWLATELGIRDKVDLVGLVAEENKIALIKMADVFVMPSRVNPKLIHEGFGLAYIEAAAFGVPGIGTRAGGIPDAIVDGKTGLLVPEESPDELASALIFLQQNPQKREEMGKSAMQRAVSQFSPKVVAAHFQNEVRKKMQYEPIDC